MVTTQTPDMTTTPAERQASSRAQKKAAGFVRTTLRLDQKSIVRLRRLAKQHATTQAKVIELALLLAESRTAQQAPAPATRRPAVIITKPTAKPASALPSASAPPCDTDTSPTPVEPPESPPSSPEHPDDSDARIRAAAADAYRLEP